MADDSLALVVHQAGLEMTMLGSMRVRVGSRPTMAFFVAALGVIGVAGSLASAQSHPPDYARQSDVIYGRKFGLALTMEVFAPTKPNGVGVVWVVSSSGRSSREQTLQPTFERRVLPLVR